MKKKKVSFTYKNKKISINTFSCNFFELGRGLTFRFRESAPSLLFERWRGGSMALTAIFVFFPFYVLWLDEKNNVVDIRRVKPFTPVIDTLKKSYTKILEIPINKRYKALIKDLVE